MSIAFVQSNSRNQGATVSSTVTLAGAVGSGNFVYVSVVLNLISTTCVVTDDQGNTYTEIDHADGSSSSVWHFYAKNVTNGPTVITVTAASSTTIRTAVQEYSGVDTTSPIDVFGQNSGTSASPSVSVTTTVPNDLLINAVRWSAANTFTPTGGYTTRESQPASPLFGTSDLLDGGLAGSETATCTIGASVTWNALLVAVKAQQALTPIALVPATRYRIHEYTYAC